MKVDHLMWACSDLDAGIAEIEALTGIRSEVSGSHPGLGTRNALLSLGETCYLEIIAPDPAQTLENNFGARLRDLTTSGIVAVAMTSADLENLKLDFGSAGFGTSEVRTTQRETASGDCLTWQLLFVGGVTGAPFYIDWLECVHPAVTSPAGCELLKLGIESDDVPAYQQLLGEMDPLVSLVGGTAFKLTATVKTPRGEAEILPLKEKLAIF